MSPLDTGADRLGFSQPLPSPSLGRGQTVDGFPASAPSASSLPGTLTSKVSPAGHASSAVKPVFGGNKAGGSQQTGRPLTGLNSGEGGGAEAGVGVAAGNGAGDGKQATVLSAEVQVGRALR